ncbi:MAG: leucine--tRNA ligase [Candidatus Pacebacteria bacterium]|nr:leucine--tRNA ligase [Candidatus Paceibacterota bacterium]MDD2796381.1 leucine--tRNA ligase [Candidatus Paceibacterota bacterium]MDD3048085.1 leucine--tRNA ligase [Candidatus Paceibacterota bacterium]MDD3509838.1 leucine--tRNA ligase [Candidatus Paceibacterota bacterium]MDD3918398.1 leucine--tRNA ligase [Candidatus Paceibacterota bacterium]
MKYEPKNFEKKWQLEWEKKNVFKTEDDSSKPKCYILDMFPYPSGAGLHVGHFKGYVATDILSRFRRMQGFNVLHPMGWDAFGLPAENYAIKTGTHPEIITKQNISSIKKQMKEVGLSYDWGREINTTDPEYYKWTQWIFLKMFEKGLAYEANMPINWCPSCKTGLANEEVVNGECERCGTPVEQRRIRQWVLRITKYAERLLNDLDDLDWGEKIKEMQRNWIGKSEGAVITFGVDDEKVDVFTTRPDTLFGCTYIVLAPEHNLVLKLKDRIKNKEELEEYLNKVKLKSERERIAEVKDKTGVRLLGVSAINPINKKEVPVFVADYVLAHYGTGAVMAVPAHDERDFEFAKKFNLDIVEVIKGGEVRKEAYTGEGVLINSGEFNGLDSNLAKEKIVNYLGAKKETKYKLRDWIFSRQRYWGEPIPLIHCPKCGIVPVPESELPLGLPKVLKYEPTNTGESPLANISEWVNVKCPICNEEAKRETNTMPQWAGSCWYYLRFIDPYNNKEIVDKKKEKHFMPVDLYVGGAEHAVLHLLYARFWHKFLYDINVVSEKEPFKKLRNVGLILAYDAQKMSKSKGNTVSSSHIIDEYGADTLRVYEMFMGPFFDAIAWNMQGVKGVSRFLNRFWNVCLDCRDNDDIESSREVLREENILIKKVKEDLKEMKFNTAIAFFMEFLNFIEKRKYEVSLKTIENVLKIFYPFAPHMAEELWKILGKENYIHEEKWPKYDESLIVQDKMELVIQVNGKVREKVEVEVELKEEELKEITLNNEKVLKWIKGKEIRKIIFIPPKLINIVI